MPTLEDTVHPLGTTKGDAIPFNLARPHGCIISPITDVVSAAFVLSDITVPHVLLSNIDCLVGFNVIPDRTSIVYQLNVVFVPAGKEVAVMPTNASLKVQALNATEIGKLVVQAFARYEAIGRSVLQPQLG